MWGEQLQDLAFKSSFRKLLTIITADVLPAIPIYLHFYEKYERWENKTKEMLQRNASHSTGIFQITVINAVFLCTIVSGSDVYYEKLKQQVFDICNEIDKTSFLKNSGLKNIVYTRKMDTVVIKGYGVEDVKDESLKAEEYGLKVESFTNPVKANSSKTKSNDSDIIQTDTASDMPKEKQITRSKLIAKYSFPYEKKSEDLGHHYEFCADSQYRAGKLVLNLTNEPIMFSLGSFNGLFKLFIGTKGYYVVDVESTVCWFLGPLWDNVKAFITVGAKPSCFQELSLEG